MCLEGGNGAWGRDRTADTVIFSHVLYQLSYPGIIIFTVSGEVLVSPSPPVEGPMANRISLGKPKKHIP